MSALLQIASIAAVILIAMWTLGWWLRGQLQDIKDAGDTRTATLQTAINKKYDEHETKDQERHEDNLGRFASSDVRLGIIETKLNILVRNGSH